MSRDVCESNRRVGLCCSGCLRAFSSPVYRIGTVISIVIPAYMSSRSLPILIHGVEDVLRGIGRPFEIVVVDDCSKDDTWDVLLRLKVDRPHLKICRLLKNSGQHNALLCGFTLAKGEVIVTMDDDLQNPPDQLPKLIAAIDEGYDLAVGAYDSKKHSYFRNLGGRLIDWVQRKIFSLPSDFQLTSFRAVRRTVINHVVQMRDSYPYITSMLLAHTERYVNVPVRHEKRQHGKSSYNLKRSVFLALNLLFHYSPYPIYLILTLCVCAFLFSGGILFWVFWSVIIYGKAAPGWASTIMTISFFNGVILLAMVIQGFYLARLSRKVNQPSTSYSIGELHE